MNEVKDIMERYLVSDNNIIRDLKHNAMQGNAACTKLLLSQISLSLNLVLAGAASKVIKAKVENMLSDIEQMKNHS